MRVKGKLESYARMKQVRDEYLATIPEEEADKRAAVPSVYDRLREKILRSEIFETGKRLDGRSFDEIRPITCEVGVLPRTHGSALFTRGETQALVTATLGTSEDSQIIDTVQEEEYRKRFMLHYNFPPFSVGEVRSCGDPAGARSATACSPSGPSSRMLPRTTSTSRTRPDRLRHPGVQRLVLDGDRLRGHAGADGRRCAAQEPDRRRGHGSGQGG